MPTTDNNVSARAAAASGDQQRLLPFLAADGNKALETSPDVVGHCRGDAAAIDDVGLAAVGLGLRFGQMAERISR